MTYGILNANREELKIDGKTRRTDDYARAFAAWRSLPDVMICFLVVWLAEEVFTVLEPKV